MPRLPALFAVLCIGLAPAVAGPLAPPVQAAPLQHAIERFLLASRLTLVDPRAAEQEFAHARHLERALPEPAATLMKHVNDRDVRALGPKLLPYLAALGNDPALSPERSPAPAARVYLLHGQDDSVIPAAESRYLARYLERKAPVDLLVSGLLTHADAGDHASIVEGWKLIAFWSRLLRD